MNEEDTRFFCGELNSGPSVPFQCMTSPGPYHNQTQRAAFLNVFMIVGSNDRQIFNCDLTNDGIRDDSPHLDEFIIHAALDAVDSMLVCQNNILTATFLGIFTGFLPADGRQI